MSDEEYDRIVMRDLANECAALRQRAEAAEKFIETLRSLADVPSAQVLPETITALQFRATNLQARATVAERERDEWREICDLLPIHASPAALRTAVKEASKLIPSLRAENERLTKLNAGHMSTPNLPLAPKSVIEYSDHYGLHITGVSQVSGMRTQTLICWITANKHEIRVRRIIAAVANLEWTERAERWGRLEMKYYRMECRTCAGKQMVRTFRCGNARTRSKDNAAAWRAWGETRTLRIRTSGEAQDTFQPRRCPTI